MSKARSGAARRVEPTQTVLGALPNWANVAFAVRCARRAFPLIKKGCPKLKPVHLRGLATGLEMASASARRGAVDYQLVRFRRDVVHPACIEVLNIHTNISVRHREGSAEETVTNCALLAADAVEAAVDAALSERRVRVAYFARYAGALVAHVGLSAMCNVVRGRVLHGSEVPVPTPRKSGKLSADELALELAYAHFLTVRALWSDVDRLGELARKRRWTDRSGVDSNVLGDLWPDGPPASWFWPTGRR